MNKTVLLVLAVIITSVTGGCTFLGNAKKDFEESTSKPIPRVNDSQPAAKTKTAEEEEVFADIEEEDREETQAIAGLIPATNPDTRVRSSIRGRQDPFSVVTLVPKIEIEEEESEPVQPTNNRTNRTNRTNRDRNRVNQRANNNRNNRSPNLIEEFKTELAQKVIVSGLYRSNGKTKLIVKAPEEKSSRYVEVGQYISNGQVLVKDINLNHFPTPTVILEQSGVEVTKSIGETPEDSRNRVSSLPVQNPQTQTLLSNISLNLVEAE